MFIHTRDCPFCENACLWYTLINSYGLTPRYSLSGLDADKFEIDESGNLSWKKDALPLSKRKTLTVVITASVDISDLFEAASTDIVLTVKVK